MSYLTPDLCETQPEPWVFPGFTRDRLLDLFQAVDLSPDQLRSFTATLHCQSEPAGCMVYPQPETVRSLAPKSRSSLYGVLAQYSENPSFLYGFRRKTEDIENWFRLTGLRPTTQASLKALMWTQKNITVFSDLAPLCLGLGPEEKLNVVKALSRTPALLVRLRVEEPDVDRDGLVAYWGRGARTRDIQPILTSLARRAESTTIDVLHLLPVFARTRLNTYPQPDDPKWDCHYSSLNFLRDVPDEKYLDGASVRDTVESDTDEIPLSEARLGDVIFFVAKDNTVLHSAVYVADGIVFTKNGKSFRKPWILLSLDEVMNIYNLDGGKIQVRRFRDVP